MKKVIWATGFVVVGLVALALLLPLALSSDMLRSALARQLSQVADAEVSFDGPIHFSVFPDFGIVIEDLTYASRDGVLSLASQRSVASVNPLSLFSDQIRITGIELRTPRIVLGDAAPGEAAPQAAGESEDIFRLASSYLERFSFDSVEVTDGEIARSSGGVLQLVASDIDLHLAVPGIGQPASLRLAGTIEGKRTELTADIGSLRDLLGRQPARFSLTATSEQPPHPALADVRVAGTIQLAEDGSYRMTDGEIDSAGQKMRLDFSYLPGDRPFVSARIGGGTLDYSDFAPAETQASGAAPDDTVPDGGMNLSALRGFDADIQLHLEAMRVGEAVASDVALEAALRNGQLGTTLAAAQIADGGLNARLQADLNQPLPQASGTLALSGVDIESLMRLAGRQVPATGRLSTQLQYAFLSTDPILILETINLRGTVSIAGGTVTVPQLAQFADSDAALVQALDASVEIEDIATPLALSGTARWNGENIGFSSTLAMADLLAGEAGATTLQLRSPPLNADFSGTVALDGRASGNANISAPSLSRALAWFGQDSGTTLGRFGFSGNIAAGASQLSLSDASFSLDDMNARGSLSVATGGKPTVTAALSVDALDFGKLTGGGGSAGGSTGPAPIDLSILRQFDADIRLEAQQISYGDVVAGPATATLSVAGGVAHLLVPQAGFYGGAVVADITANGTGDVPAIAATAGMNGVDALPLLRAAAGFEHLEGKLTAELDVTGSGTNTEAFARSLNGLAGVMFSDGALRGIDVANLVRNVQSLLGGSGYAQDAEARTEFTELSVALDIQNGIGRTDEIRLLGPLVRMSGEGQIDLADRTIDMRLDPRVVGSLEGQGSEFDVSGLGMPIIITGALAGPSIYPDLSGLLANPGQALEALSGLGEGIGDFSTGASETIDRLRDTLEGESGSVMDGVASGLIDQLTGGQPQDGNATDPLPGNFLDAIFGGTTSQTPQAPEQPVEQTPTAPEPMVIETPAEEPVEALPTPGPVAPETPAEEPVETPPAQPVPEQAHDPASDLIRGLLEQMGEQ